MPKSVLRAVLGRMQFTLHATRRTPHGASRLVQATSAWLVKTRRALSRRSRHARVYSHTTTAMHKLSNPPPLKRWDLVRPDIRAGVSNPRANCTLLDRVMISAGLVTTFITQSIRKLQQIHGQIRWREMLTFAWRFLHNTGIFQLIPAFVRLRLPF